VASNSHTSSNIICEGIEFDGVDLTNLETQLDALQDDLDTAEASLVTAEADILALQTQVDDCSFVKGIIAVTVSALNAAAEEDISVTISGAAAGDVVMMTPLDAAMETGVGVLASWVSATNTVKIRVTNASGSQLTGSTSNWSYLLIQS
jgi:hypothetical protein